MRRGHGARNLSLLLLLVFIAEGGGEHSAAASSAPQRPSAIAKGALRSGEAAPPFDLPRLGGGRLSLASLKGKVVLLAFWTPG